MCTTKTRCETIQGYMEDGTPILKPKIKYKTHEKAVKACKTFNLQQSQIKKLVTYKCPICFQYHIGRNGKDVKPKYRDKIRKLNDQAGEAKMRVGFKVVGKIDLSKLA